MDAYKNCILSDFDMYTSQSPSRDWNKKWDKDCKDTKDYKCELLKEALPPLLDNVKSVVSSEPDPEDVL